MITDRVRWSVIQANTNQIMTHDLNVMEPEIMINLSGPSRMAFKLLPTEEKRSSFGIDWKTLGHVVVANIEIDYVEQIFAVGVVTDHKVDPKSGVLQVETTGFIGYPKGEPCLINFNPIAVDPFEVVQTVWAFLQGFSNAQMGVEVYPASSGTQMLPGYSFDGSILSFDFFAIFLRAVDFPDSAGIIAGLARDIPFDMFEEAEWNLAKTELTPKIRLAYPFGGLQQVNLAFRMGENVISGERAEEMDVEPVSDIVIRSWLPGRVISSQLQNADLTRYRRTAMEEDVYIESTERAAAWARRKLQKRNIPKSFSKIVVLPNHPHAPFGSYSLGDSIYIEAPDYPWTGDIAEWHRITSMAYAQDTGLLELGVMVEGAFNYDPIDYDPNPVDNPTEDLNRLANGYFSDNLNGWISLRGQWIRVATVTFDTVLNPNAGCVRIDLDDAGERFRSNRAFCTPGEHLKIQTAVRWQEVASGGADAFQLLAFLSHDSTPVGDPVVIDQYVNPLGTHGWELFQDSDYVVPDGVNEISLQFTVTAGVTAGIAFWTYARIVPSGSLP
jgi:hypothetical protein